MSIQDVYWPERLQQWERGIPAGPLKITMFPTNRCNLRCAICWQRTIEVNWEELPDERWLKLVEEAAELGVQRWIIIGGGEPMVRADLLIAMAKRIRELGMNGGIHTNGTLFTKKHFETLCDIHWGNITVSLDGPNPQINDAIRSKGSFEKATRNLRMLADIKKQRDITYPGAGIYCTLTRTNCRHMTEMLELHHNTGCDLAFDISNLIENENETCKNLALKKEDQIAFHEELRRALPVAERYGIRNNFHYFLPAPPSKVKTQPTATPAPKPIYEGLARATCLEPWLSVSILPDGRLGPCCAFWGEDALSIRNASFKDIWLGAYMNQLRENLQNKILPSYCRHCPSNLSENVRRQRAAYSERYRQARGNRQQCSTLFMGKASPSIAGNKESMDGAKNRILSTWETGKPAGPYRIIASISRQCNLKCPACAQTQNNGASEIAGNRWLQLVDEAAHLGVKEWLFAGGGEPMVHGELIMEMCAKIRKHGMSGALHTNGTLFTPNQLKALVKMGWNLLSISLDGPSPQINDPIRGNGVFERALETARLYTQYRKQMGSPDSRLALAFYLNTVYSERLDAMIKLAQSMEADIFELIDPIIPTQDPINNPALTDEEWFTIKYQTARIAAQVQGLQDDIHLPPAFQPGCNPELNPYTPPTTGTFASIPCLEPWLNLTITPDGIALPCHTMQANQFDNIREKSLSEVWQGPALTKLRQQIQQAEYPGQCHGCTQCESRQFAQALNISNQIKTRFSISPLKILTKTTNNLRNRGLRQTIQRGKEWLQLRKSIHKK